MSARQLRRQRAAGPFHELHFDPSGRLFAFETPDTCVGRRFAREWSEAQTLAAEVRNGVRWPWLNTDRVIAALRRETGSCRDQRFVRAQGLVRPDGDITRKGLETLYFLTRVYL